MKNVVTTLGSIAEDHLIGMLPAKPAATFDEQTRSFFAVRFPVDVQGMKKMMNCVFVEDSRKSAYHNELLHLQPSENPNCILEGWRMRFNHDETPEFRVVVKAKRIIKAEEILTVKFNKGFLSDESCLDISSPRKRRFQGFLFSTYDFKFNVSSFNAGGETPSKEARIEKSTALVVRSTALVVRSDSSFLPASIPIQLPAGNVGGDVFPSSSAASTSTQQPGDIGDSMDRLAITPLTKQPGKYIHRYFWYCF